MRYAIEDFRRGLVEHEYVMPSGVKGVFLSRKPAVKERRFVPLVWNV